MAKFRTLLRGAELDVFDFLCLRQQWPEQSQNQMNVTDEFHFGRSPVNLKLLSWLTENTSHCPGSRLAGKAADRAQVGDRPIRRAQPLRGSWRLTHGLVES